MLKNSNKENHDNKTSTYENSLHKITAPYPTIPRLPYTIGPTA